MRKFAASMMACALRAGAIAGALSLAAGSLYAQTAGSALPPGDGKDLLAVACTQCHGLKPIVMLHDGAAGWKTVVEDMIMRGAQLEAQESATVVQYLAKNFGPMANTTKTAALPAGPGKELVEERCMACHGVEKITGEKRTKQEWGTTVKKMAERGLSVTPEEIQTISSYLAAQFGK
jgi:cytochrome c5